jgi:hypothetical protein
MPPVAVRILHPLPDAAAGPLARWVADGRSRLAQRLRSGFEAAGADDVAIVEGSADGRTFGARLRDLVGGPGPGGLVVLGSGAIPLATAADRLAFVLAAGSDERQALANNRYSADIVAIARSDRLPAIPDLPGDNALPRWLEEVAGYRVQDLRRRWRLAVDIDGPLDLVLTDDSDKADDALEHGIDLEPVMTRLQAVSRAAGDPRSELLVAGRTSGVTVAWLERHTGSRTRVLIEERGLRAANSLALAGPGEANRRPPASVLGALLERDGPESLGHHLARLADAAIVDTRVLLAHRLGADEAAWPPAEERFASDVFLADRVADPWLRALTASAAAAPIPILLGGHTLVGPGVRLIVGRSWS